MKDATEVLRERGRKGAPLTLDEVRAMHDRLTGATVAGVTVDAWNRAQGALFELALTMQTAPARALLEQAEEMVERVADEGDDRPAGALQTQPVTYGELREGDLFDPNGRGLAHARLVQSVELQGDDPVLAVVTCTDGYAAEVNASWPAKPQPARAADPTSLRTIEGVIEAARRANCTCADVDPRVIQGGGRCDACETAEQQLHALRIVAEDRAAANARSSAEVRS